MSEEFNFEEEIRKLWKRDPFVPFEIVVTSGDRYEINDPIQLAMGGNMVVVVPAKKGLQFFRKNQIVAVEVHEPAS